MYLTTERHLWTKLTVSRRCINESSISGIRNIRSQDYSFPGTFVPMMALSFSGPFVPWNVRSLDWYGILEFNVPLDTV